MKPNLRAAPLPAAQAFPDPLSIAEFAALMKRFAPFSSPLAMAVAVSGGPDSTALAYCAKRWLEQSKGKPLLALIVDHGLRSESASEAETTQKVLAGVGIKSEILPWRHPPVVSRMHETARRARYQLLTEACRRRGIGDLLLAHHREDQAETILMRLAKGSGVDGLAGMAAETMLDGVRILRPLLGTAKERLTATCIGAGVSFVADPSNDMQKFARGRLRRVMPLLALDGLTVERLSDLGARAAEAKAALDYAAHALVRVASLRDASGTIRIGIEHMRSAPRAIALRALSLCLRGIHREDYAPDYAALSRLLGSLLADEAMPARTLSGCLVAKSKTHISIMREFAAITDCLPIAPGETVTWDQRWRVFLQASAAEAYAIRPLGNPTHEVLERLAPGLRRRMPKGRARAGLPSLWFKEALALIPALPGCTHVADAYAEPVSGWPPAAKD